MSMGLMVCFHELGHYLMAKRHGIQVDAFSIGFGKAIYQWKDKENTTWRIGWIPFGGYVAFAEKCDEGRRIFKQATIKERAQIVMAGPMTNLILGFLCFFAVMSSQIEVRAPILGEVAAGSFAQEVGFKTGDEVKAVNGVKVESLEEWQTHLSKWVSHPEIQLIAKVQRQDGSLQELMLPGHIQKPDMNQWMMKSIGWLADGTLPEGAVVLKQVKESGAFGMAGLKSGDHLTQVNEEEIHSWAQLLQVIHANPKQKRVITFERNGIIQHADVLIGEQKGWRGNFGIAGIERPVSTYRMRPNEKTLKNHFEDAFKKTMGATQQVVSGVIGLVMGEVSIRQLSGPVGIAFYAEKSLSIGWMQFIQFTGLLSISLFVLNLLPIPVLDGGYLCLLGLEVIRKKPLTKRMEQHIHMIGFAFIMLMTYIGLVNDVRQWFGV
jgi:regulator of sigma E protease